MYENARMIAIDEKTLIICETDRAGKIRYASDDLCRITGYSQEELLGKPYGVLWRADMPQSVFKNMWETIESGATWKGFVKSATKNGDYYWVYTTIFPIVSANGEGYLSVRARASDEEIERYEARYAQTRDKELQ
ncbi:MAG: PAS domain S-box protein [Helicobacteraceae bacterium]|jgi:PAS domain S-box-containing protein|nr:PAS domain S-box protein [Helicobacteraceae bacterium]